MPSNDSPLLIDRVGHWRVYFNRWGAAPLLWCISTSPALSGPSWEIAVRGVRIIGDASTDVDGTAILGGGGDIDRSRAWIAVFGHLTIDASGLATINGAQ